MAQLVEQRIRNAWVAGSSPAIGSLLSQESGQPRADSFLFPSGGISSVGRALASQAEGRGFESRNPLNAGYIFIGTTILKVILRPMLYTPRRPVTTFSSVYFRRLRWFWYALFSKLSAVK